jgi:glycine oxidase
VTRPRSTDRPGASRSIGIAGAGLLGRLLAWRLAAAGHRVQVFDPAPDANEPAPADPRAAGWTAAGMLSPIAELESADAQTAARGWRSLDEWAEIVPQLPRPVDFRRDGSLMLAHRSDLGAAQRLLDQIKAKSPVAQLPQPIGLEQLRELEPSLHGPSHAWLLKGEGQIHTVQAMQALADAATRLGVQWHWGRSVRQIEAARLDDDRFDWVFDVRGLGARPDLPVRGVRGEILWLHAPGVALTRAVRLLHPRLRVYIVPRPGDIVVVGASEIESEDRSPVSVRSVLGLLSAAHSVIPELAEARIVRTETNLRPALPDNLPRLETCDGLTRINGLFRHGWLLAPALVDEALHDAGLVPQRREAA